ncbi:oxygen-independent coproporphyrinogen III oxidase [Haliea sp. E1-2-M8]|uniref:oxygen-independent coproporphyrinogen III oxidase n=1 Tax=Haliea sp. E1-2-M8 TaxID=3064706 RepID=UPI00271A5D4B|nr:oxygen-independent coproporphyrinogen III oxidase [Haliea sp. E1-2-M8]MDO8860288.1 oxygen-independent coproporphyrinogen III oxidase [Haliea sp. E1-2-M8]
MASPNAAPTRELTTASLWDPALIARYNLAGPRYTSYPTAAQFRDDVSETQWREAITASNEVSAPLSLYFHIPFCNTVCYYCACNKIVTANRQRASDYLRFLHREIELQAAAVNPERIVRQLHWGGGTPTYISDSEMQSLMTTIRQEFRLATDDEGEFSIEVHPGGMAPERIRQLRKLGFNRLSMGVQDFDPEVQQAVNRFNNVAEVAALVAEIRTSGFKSLSMDLIYGLPLQSEHSFARTLDQVIRLQPDRLSLFNYAHMPQLFKTQRQIDESQLPAAGVKLAILQQSIDRLLQEGYEYIGMDHFARPGDELALAQMQGTLHRNFQGYSTHKDCELLAFGVSAINALGNNHFQNFKDEPSYTAAITAGKLPLAKRITLSRDDIIRRAVINELICNFALDYQAIEEQFGIRFADYFSAELERLPALAADGLLALSAGGIAVLPAGRLLVRRICMEFDAYIDPSQLSGNRFSRII